MLNIIEIYIQKRKYIHGENDFSWSFMNKSRWNTLDFILICNLSGIILRWRCWNSANYHFSLNIENIGTTLLVRRRRDKDSESPDSSISSSSGMSDQIMVTKGEFTPIKACNNFFGDQNAVFYKRVIYRSNVVVTVPIMFLSHNFKRLKSIRFNIPVLTESRNCLNPR